MTKRYGQHRAVLNDFSLDVAANEFVGVMGPSGAGKSTLLNIIATLTKPTSGTVHVGDQPVTQWGDAKSAAFRRTQLGLIVQTFNLIPELTVADNLALPLTMLPPRPKDLAERVAQVADQFGLEPLLTQYPHQLSGGQQQRVAAARAIITRPRLILADEPTGSLDSHAATTFLQHLDWLHRRAQTTILMVTHDAFTASFCDRIVFIKDGQFFAEVTRHGDREAFFERIIDMAATIGGGRRQDATFNQD
nr:ABC transporter ATP-binding protein [Lacticaseibacillus kribbianus]